MPKSYTIILYERALLLLLWALLQFSHEKHTLANGYYLISFNRLSFSTFSKTLHLDEILIMRFAWLFYLESEPQRLIHALGLYTLCILWKKISFFPFKCTYRRTELFFSATCKPTHGLAPTEKSIFHEIYLFFRCK